MRIKDFIFLNTIPSGKTYNQQVLDYFNVDYSEMKALDVYEKVNELTKIKQSTPTSKIDGKIKINGKWFYIEKDITKATYEQWISLESILLDEEYMKTNLHKLLALYVRPRKWNWFRYKIEKYNTDRKEFIENELLEMDMDIASSLNVFFYQGAELSIENMKRYYLVGMEEMRNQVLI